MILNRKYHDPEAQTRLAEQQAGKNREELGLQMETLRHSRRGEKGRLDGGSQLKLSD